MPSAKTNRVEPWAFRKPNVRESKRGDDAESADANMCVQRAHSTVVMATPCGGSHLGCERARAAMQRPCCWRAQLNTHLQRRLLWSSVTWLKYRNKQEPQRAAAASLSVRCLLAAGRAAVTTVAATVKRVRLRVPGRDLRRPRDVWEASSSSSDDGSSGEAMSLR